MRRLLILFVAGAVGLAGCGGSEEAGYDGDFHDSFMASCIAAVGPDAEAVCQCTFDRMVEFVPFERAQRLDRRLRDDPENPLPDDIAELISGCVAETVPPTIATTTTSTTAPEGGTTTTTAPADGSTTTTSGEAG